MRRKLKHVLLAATRRLGGVAMHQRLADRLSGVGGILLMHRVVASKADCAAHNLSVTASYLDETLTYLRRTGTEVVPLRILGARLAAGGPFDRRAVALTFDDGYRDNLTLALPILRKHQAPATIFVPSGAPDRSMDVWFLRLEKAIMSNDVIKLDIPGLPSSVPAGSPIEKYVAYEQIARFVHRDIRTNKAVVERLLPGAKISDEALADERFASWSELRDAAADPLLTIGGHTVSHPVLCTLDAKDALGEMVGGRDRLAAQLDRAVGMFSYPYGGRTECGRREFDLAARAGFELAVTTRYDNIQAHHRDSAMALPRMTLGGLREHLDALAFDVFGLLSRDVRQVRHEALVA